MCDRAEFDSGRKLETAPRLFIGATVNPFVPPYADRVINMEKKILAGARFIQTQFCFDVGLLESFMREVRRRELHTRAHILVGVGTLSSARALAWMAGNVPGVHIPTTFIERVAKAPDQRQAASQACLQIIRAVTQIEGVAGIHVMGHRNEDTLAEIIRDSGLRGLPESQTNPYAITGDTA
jgi:5,10-methylenetetrahydrofolate reductase